MSASDVEEVHRVWSLTIEEIKNGAGLRKAKWGNKQIIKNNLPGMADSYIVHVRPHTRKAAYKLNDGTIIGDITKHGDRLPNGEWMTKQSFWLNATYVEEVIKKILEEDNKNQFKYNYNYPETEIQVAQPEILDKPDSRNN